jgi:hypothetical protein
MKAHYEYDSASPPTRLPTRETERIFINFDTQKRYENYTAASVLI